jgi:uncharacterized protein YgbK (DUF1537 family)
MMAGAGGGSLACFYGDDFTGSTDALGQYARFGWRSILLLSVEAIDDVSVPLGEYDIVGVAGITRSLPTDVLESELRRGFDALARLRPRILQYKVCSTFDSSPQVGSIGRAAEVAREIFGPTAIPVLPAQPEFGRYTAFANHFAANGDQVLRLDRNRSTAGHPVTPMREADLRRHLGEQTSLRIGSIDIRAVQAGPARLKQAVESGMQDIDIAIFDALTNDDLRQIGEVLVARAGDGPAFAIGSGGLSYGVSGFLGDGSPPRAGDLVAPGASVEQLLVVSGSCSGQTATQIADALECGWSGVHVPVEALLRDEASAVSRARRAALDALRAGRSVVVYTACGPEDPGVAAGTAAAHRAGIGPGRLAPVVGRAFGAIVREARADLGIQRVIVTGGDTCGCTLRELDAWGLEVLGAVVPAGFLCRLRSHDVAWDGLELLLKGGQVGGAGLFEQVRSGHWPGMSG